MGQPQIYSLNALLLDTTNEQQHLSLQLDAFHLFEFELQLFFHHAQKLPGVAGEAFHVAPLPLGVDGVKGQGAFPRAGNPGDDDELAPGKLQADVLQVVLPSAPDDDAVHPWKYTTPSGDGGRA